MQHWNNNWKQNLEIKKHVSHVSILHHSFNVSLQAVNSPVHTTNPSHMSAHYASLCDTLHWLPVVHHVHYKIAIMTFNGVRPWHTSCLLPWRLPSSNICWCACQASLCKSRWYSQAQDLILSDLMLWSFPRVAAAADNLVTPTAV